MPQVWRPDAAFVTAEGSARRAMTPASYVRRNVRMAEIIMLEQNEMHFRCNITGDYGVKEP